MKPILTDNSVLTGDCSELTGDHSGLWGNCTGLRGNCSGLWGDLADCELTTRERMAGVNIRSLVGHGETV